MTEKPQGYQEFREYIEQRERGRGFPQSERHWEKRIEEEKERARRRIAKAANRSPRERRHLSFSMADIVDDFEDDVLRADTENLRGVLEESAYALGRYIQVIKWTADREEHHYLISPRLIVDVLSCAAASKGMPYEEASDAIKEAIRLAARNDALEIDADFSTESQEGWARADHCDWLTTPPPKREEIINGFLPRNVVGVLAAQGGTGKTFLCLEIAMSLTTGRQILPSITPSGPCRVMHLIAEEMEAEIHSRIYSVKQDLALALTDEALALFNQNYMPICPTAVEPLLEVRDGKAQTTERYKWLCELVERFKPDLLIIDPKAQWDATDENDNAHATAFVEAMKGLIRHGVGAVLLVHHSSKASNAGSQRNALTSDMGRGASALRDACRWAAGMRELTPQRAQELLGKSKKVSAEWCGQYVEFAITKNNWGRTMSQPLFLKKLDGGTLAEVDLDDELLLSAHETEDKMAVVAFELGTNTLGMTDRDITKGATAEVKAFYDRVRQRLNIPTMPDARIRELYERAKEANLISVVKAGGRSKIPRVITPAGNPIGN